jgi:hypothetical protein
MVLESWVDLRVVYKCAEMLCQLVFIESYVDNLTWKSGSYLVYATLLFIVLSIPDFRYFGLLSCAHATVNVFIYNKTLLRLAMARIKLLHNKRDIQVKQMRKEIAQPLTTGQEPSARIRV